MLLESRKIDIAESVWTVATGEYVGEETDLQRRAIGGLKTVKHREPSLEIPWGNTVEWSTVSRSGSELSMEPTQLEREEHPAIEV